MPRFRVAAAQLNVVVGDLEGNAARILEAYDEAEAAGCDLVVFPELTVTGYPPEDLLLRPAFVAQAAETLDKIAARTGACGRGDRLPRAGPRPLQRGRRVRERPRATASTASSCCRTTRCSTSSATSSRRREPRPAVRHRGREGRRLDLRGRVEPDRPDPRRGRGRRRAHRQPQRVAVLRGAARASARRCSRHAPPTRRCRSSTPTSSAARTSSCSTARRSCSTSTGMLVAPRQAVRRGPARRRHRRAARVPQAAARSARPRRGVAAARRSTCPSAHPPTHASRRAIEPTLDAGARGLRGAGARHARLRAQERLHRRADRPLGRHRLRRSSPRSRSTRSAPSTCTGVLHAVALLERPQRHRRRRARREPRDHARSPCRSSPRTRRSRRCSRRCSRARRRASPRRTCRRASAATC